MAAPLNREQKRQAAKKDGGAGGGGAGGGGAAGASDEGGSSRRRSGTAISPDNKEPRTSARQFVKEVRAELRKVAWPTRAETLNYSLIVAATLVVMTLLIFGLDWVFSETVLRLFNIK